MRPTTSPIRTIGFRPLWGGLALVLLPALLAGQETEEQGYAPAETLGCKIVFAVFAPTQGEPRTVRRCPREDGGDLYLAPTPIVGVDHIDSVAVAEADSGLARVDVRLTEEGAGRMREFAALAAGDDVAAVLDGRVVSRFRLGTTEPTSRLTLLSSISRGRAERVARRLRTEAAREGHRAGRILHGNPDLGSPGSWTGTRR